MGDPRPVWPERLCELAKCLRTAETPEARDDILGRIWPILVSALDLHVARHAAKMGSIPREDREDLASEKALDLLRKIDGSAWRPEDEPPGKTVMFVSSLARNGLVDWLRVSGPRTRSDVEIDVVLESRSSSEDPARSAERTGFVRALKGCVRDLKEVARTVWLLRALYDLSSRQIAEHPEVETTAQNVDVILMRARKRLSKCLAKKGFSSEDLKPGTFAALWVEFRAQPSSESGESRD